jgi:hypothetical protein
MLKTNNTIRVTSQLALIMDSIDSLLTQILISNNNNQNNNNKSKRNQNSLNHKTTMSLTLTLATKSKTNNSNKISQQTSLIFLVEVKHSKTNLLRRKKNQNQH